ncbi:MAG: response regulator [Chloroflexi bacterium]|nr:MAG: response regulator [Chloroflexota bacterium]
MPEKILVVDDDVDSLKLIGLMLQKNGYEVIAANNGSRALQKATAEIPDLIILDVMMPDMNGYEVCRRLRANPDTQNIPIIMFTAKTLIDDKVAGFEAGADDYLTKPTHPAELASRVRAILARSSSGKQPKKGPSKGATIGIIGAKGGVGTTTLAINLGAAMLQQGDDPIICDLRLGQGSMGLFLGLGRSHGLANVLRRPPQDINAGTIEGEIVTHASGLRTLLSSARPREMEIKFTPDMASALIEGLRQLGRPTIFDLGAGLNRITAHIQRQMDKLILIVEPNTPTLTMARELINDLAAEGAGRINVAVVNRAQSSLQTPWHEVEKILGQDIRAIISAAPELAFQAIEAGTPIVLYQPNAIVASQMIKLAEDMKPRIRSIAGGDS